MVHIDFRNRVSALNINFADILPPIQGAFRECHI